MISLRSLASLPLFAFVVYIGFLAKPGSSLFSLHPFCMALSYGCLMPIANLAFSRESLFSKSLHSKKIQFHWTLMVASAITALAGFFAIYINKNINDKPHFASYHGILGLVAILLMVFQNLAGIVAKYPHLLRGVLAAPFIRKMHACSGLSTYSVGMAALFLAFKSNWYQNNGFIPGEMCIVIYALFLFLLLKRVLKRCFNA